MRWLLGIGTFVGGAWAVNRANQARLSRVPLDLAFKHWQLPMQRVSMINVHCATPQLGPGGRVLPRPAWCEAHPPVPPPNL